jgi:RecG-like helicase
MGLRDFFTRDSLSKEELVAERLCERFEDLNMLSLADMPLRQRVDVCGEIRRMSVKPRAGIPAVEVEISDGTGELTLVFYGRGHVPGIGHNRALTVSGVAFREGSRRVMLNPAYRLLPREGQ